MTHYDPSTGQQPPGPTADLYYLKLEVYAYNLVGCVSIPDYATRHTLDVWGCDRR